MKVGGLALVGLVGTNALSLRKEGGLGPLQKVVALLDTMSNEIRTEMTDQQKISDELQCWAATNKKEKEAAIQKNEALVAETEKKVTALTAKTEELTVKSEALTKEIADNEKELENAEKQRKKEADEFRKFETDSVKAIGQLKSAVVVLKKHQSLAQMSTEDKKALQSIVAQAGERYSLALDSMDVQKARSFLQADHYSSSSGEIFGILTQMQEQMEADLSQSQKDEATAVANFTKMRDAKTKEIREGRKELSKTNEELADTKNELQRAKKAIAEAKDQLEADRAFLADVIKRAEEDKAELEARVAGQTAELQAIAETKEILTSDEAREMLGKTVKGGAAMFMQFAMTSERRQAQEDAKADALDLLQRSGSPKLALLATQTQLAAFDKVKKAINDLVAELKTKLQDDVKKRDYCLSSFDKNQKESQETEYLMEDLDNKTVQLSDAIKKLDDKIAETSQSIEDLKIDIATATKQRKEQNKEYQQVYSDQTVTTKILMKAKQRLQDFYNAPKELLQQPGGPVGLKKGGYEKRNSTGVVGMISMIIEDSEKTKALAIADEKNASAAYEQFIVDSGASLKDLRTSLATSKEERADTSEKLQQTKEDLKDAMRTLESLQKEKAGLHKDCDFLIKNFDATQAAMAQEIEALQQAISILSGAE